MTDEHGNAITGAQANARAMQLLGDKISGQADAAANTFGGHLSELKAHFEDMAANLGAKYGPAITAVGTAMAGVGAVFQAAPAIMGILSAAWDALTAAEYASMLPYVAIIAGLALIGVAVYELVTHWSEVWGAIQAATAAVWQWIVDHWPLLLDIILGPIGIAAGLVIQHWNDIVGAAQAVWNWISDNWPLLLAILLGPFAVAALEVKNHWNDIVDFFSGLPGRIVSAIGDVASLLFGKGAEIFQSLINGITSLLGAVPDIPGAVLRAVGNLASLLYQAGRDVIQGLIDGIGSMAGALASKVKDAVGGLVSGAKGLLGIGSPSKVFAEIGMNVMQGYAAGMQAQQSYVGTTMATLLLPTTMPVAPTAPPTPPPRASGPAVHIENATFTTDADIDLLLRRAAWAMQTRAA
jgi:phage-related protein